MAETKGPKIYVSGINVVYSDQENLARAYNFRNYEARGITEVYINGDGKTIDVERLMIDQIAVQPCIFHTAICCLSCSANMVGLIDGHTEYWTIYAKAKTTLIRRKTICVQCLEFKL